MTGHSDRPYITNIRLHLLTCKKDILDHFKRKDGTRLSYSKKETVSVAVLTGVSIIFLRQASVLSPPMILFLDLPDLVYDYVT